MKTTPIAIFGAIAFLVAPLSAGTTESESEVFAFDTRDSVGTVGTVVGESGVFGVDARDWGGWSSRSSGFGLDTRSGGAGGSILIAGTVLDTDGQALFGATVVLKRYATVFWSGPTDFAGGYAVPQQAAADYTVVASMPGFAPQAWNVGGEGSKVVDFSLQAAPDVPGLLDVVREVAPGAVRGALVAGADLRLFQGGSFGSDLAELDPARPTIVITHGWNPTKTDFAQDSFVTEMATMILANHGLLEAPNIVAWDWKERAATAGPETDAAAEEGIAMGKALHQALGSGYAEPIHFIGHSLGTLVNRYACDCLHGDRRHASDNASPPWDPARTRPHMTILDEAEVASVLGEDVITSATRFTEPGQVTSTDLLDISKWAGQTVEIFFGFTGGTSSGCEVAIDGLRFQTLPPPRVAVSSQGGLLRVAWPATASGWLLESSPDLAPGNWQPEPLDGAVLEEGMSVLEGPPGDSRGFFRLRRTDPDE